MQPAPVIPAHDVLHVVPLADPVIDRVGHDPRSAYVEAFWLGVLGPSTTWLLRLLAARFDERPDGFPLQLADAARRLGLGDRGGRHSPFVRALGRCVQFELAELPEAGTLAVRRRLPPLTRRHLARLSVDVQAEHERWQEAALRVPTAEQVRRRACQLALSLVELGEDAEATERQLLRWGFHPGLAREATVWAGQRRAATAAPEPVGAAVAAAPEPVGAS
jgi:hypothetical protein